MTLTDLQFLTPGIATYGFATIAFAAFALRLSPGLRGGKKAALLLAATALSALWAALNVAAAAGSPAIPLLALGAVDALRAAAWIGFAVVLLRGAPKPAWWLGALPVLSTIGMFPPRPVFGAMLGLSIAGLVVAEQVWRRAPAEVRWSLKPLCLGLGASFVFDLYFFADALLLGRVDPDLWAARGLAQALVIPFIALATRRNKEWTIDLALSRGMVFHSTAFLACGIYLLAVAAAGYYVRYFSGSWGKAFQAGFIFAALLVLGWLFSSGTARARLRVFINKNFFPYRYDYRQEWLRFTSLLTERESSAGSLQRCIHALANLVESPAGALWLRQPDGEYLQAARWNLPAQERREAGSLPRFLARTGWVVDLAEYRADRSRYPDLELPLWLDELETAWLVIPILAQEELLGFALLASPRAPVEVNWEVRDLLKTAARQVGTFLAETRASEALLEARKFEAFNKMSAFVVHDLKNLVAQLGLLLKNAERHRQNPRFQDDMLTTVRHVSERMSKLLLQLSTGSRGEESIRPIHLGELAERVARSKQDGRHEIVVEATDTVLAVGYEQRFERVLGHLVQNAIDATGDEGRVSIRILAERGEAVVQVADTGCGMSDEFVRERLFRPFQTTKAAGMGIGAFEAAQVVKEMGGSLQVHTRPGEGTRIDVLLPLHSEAAPRAGAAREAA